jgi:hypothetical protein
VPLVDDQPVGQFPVWGACRVGGDEGLGGAVVVPCVDLLAEAFREMWAGGAVADRSEFPSAFGGVLVEGLLRCAKPGQARSLILVGQIARASSSKAVATCNVVGSSVPSS